MREQKLSLETARERFIFFSPKIKSDGILGSYLALNQGTLGLKPFLVRQNFLISDLQPADIGELGDRKMVYPID